MRLTLRTLLAHLDGALDAADDAAIAEKLKESEFASKLVERVRACLTSPALGAPPPEATGTADCPNRVGEYLDSVLSAEQVAEVERICLESDPHLAEVAACHQILTLVLAEPAEVSQGLRQRIYQLDPVARRGGDGVNGQPIDQPVSAAAGKSTGDDVAGAETVEQAAAGRSSVSPVGPDDSGVSDAPTRLKSAAAATVAAGGGELAERRLRRSDLDEYRVRPTRMVPWLVSLALVAAFLYVGAKAFAPLTELSRQDQADKAVADRQQQPEDPAVDPPPAAPQAEPEAEREAEAATEPAEATEQPEPTAPPPVDDPTADPTDDLVDDAAEMPAEPAPVVEPEDPDMPPATTADQPEVPVEEKTVTEPPARPVEPAVRPELVDPEEPGEPVVVTGEGTLLLVRDPELEGWLLGKQDDVLPPQCELICPPTYRDQISLHGRVELTMVGPARLALTPVAEAVDEVTLTYGRFLLGALENDQVVRVRFADTVSELTFPTPESVAAVEVLPMRRPGADPEDPRASQTVLRVLAVQGSPSWQSGNRPEVTLGTGQLLILAPGNQLSIDDVRVVPDWLHRPAESPDSLESLARQGLLERVQGNESIELSLREALDFRRVEVAALAARTLLLLGRYDVYFGADGVFNQPRQRNYWPDQFGAMVTAINRGPETAAAVRQAIERMDGAQAQLIYRMLWLYSDRQLAAGADETLVRALDDSNMTLRVLASENLRRITGNTMNYRADESASRRATAVRRWEARLRRDEIRWASEPQTDASPAAVNDQPVDDTDQDESP